MNVFEALNMDSKLWRNFEINKPMLELAISALHICNCNLRKPVGATVKINCYDSCHLVIWRPPLNYMAVRNNTIWWVGNNEHSCVLVTSLQETLRTTGSHHVRKSLLLVV